MPNKIVKKERAQEVKNENWDLSYDTKTLITVLMLVTVYPVGLVLMLVWMKWNKWVKFLVALPFLFVLLASIFMFWMLMLVTVKGMFRPNRRVRTFDMIRERVKKEMVVSPTVEVSPTQMMISPTVRAIK